MSATCDRTGELVDVDPDEDLHRCDNGWIGVDGLKRPVPCTVCKPHMRRPGKMPPAPVVEYDPPLRRERREDVPAKAARLLASGAVTLELVIPDRVRARVQGDTGRYEVRRDAGHDWRCSCPARRGCSHCAAVALVIRADR